MNRQGSKGAGSALLHTACSFCFASTPRTACPALGNRSTNQWQRSTHIGEDPQSAYRPLARSEKLWYTIARIEHVFYAVPVVQEYGHKTPPVSLIRQHLMCCPRQRRYRFDSLSLGDGAGSHRGSGDVRPIQGTPNRRRYGSLITNIVKRRDPPVSSCPVNPLHKPAQRAHLTCRFLIPHR